MVTPVHTITKNLVTIGAMTETTDGREVMDGVVVAVAVVLGLVEAEWLHHLLSE
jgi:hypothetical protein